MVCLTSRPFARGRRPWTSRVQLLATMYPRLLYADRRSSSQRQKWSNKSAPPAVSLQRPRSFNRTEGESNALFCLSTLRKRDSCNGTLDYELTHYESFSYCSDNYLQRMCRARNYFSFCPKREKNLLLDETYYFEVFRAFVNLRNFFV